MSQMLIRKPSPSLVNFMSIHEREQVNPSHLLVTVRANGVVESARGTVYEIQDTEVIVLVLTAYGHYGDK